MLGTQPFQLLTDFLIETSHWQIPFHFWLTLHPCPFFGNDLLKAFGIRIDNLLLRKFQLLKQLNCLRKAADISGKVRITVDHHRDFQLLAQLENLCAAAAGTFGSAQGRVVDLHNLTIFLKCL